MTSSKRCWRWPDAALRLLPFASANAAHPCRGDFTYLQISYMPSSDLSRRQIIESLTAQQSDHATEAVASLWAPLATQIILIVGAGGFESLFARSVFLCQTTFPWLSGGSASAQTEAWLEDLKTRLNAQSPAMASEANCRLLLTFTDLLASLIGEPLTARILNSAWDHNMRDKIGKDEKK